MIPSYKLSHQDAVRSMRLVAAIEQGAEFTKNALQLREIWHKSQLGEYICATCASSMNAMYESFAAWAKPLPIYQKIKSEL